MGDYFINCTSNAYGQPQPMIWNINVISISMEGEIDIQMYNSIDCYDEYGTPLSNNNPWLRVPGFTVSVTKNKFMAVGCDTYAYLNGILNGQPFSVGCLSVCNNTRSIVNGTCSGIGCCQIDFPPDLRDVNFKAYSFKNHTQVWKFNPCSFAFIIQEDKFNFPQTILSVYETMKLFPWLWIGRLVMRRVKLLGTKRITYVEGIARVLISIPTTDLGTVAIAWSVTVGTHTSKTVAKVRIFNLPTYLHILNEFLIYIMR